MERGGKGWGRSSERAGQAGGWGRGGALLLLLLGLTPERHADAVYAPHALQS